MADDVQLRRLVEELLDLVAHQYLENEALWVLLAQAGSDAAALKNELETLRLVNEALRLQLYPARPNRRLIGGLATGIGALVLTIGGGAADGVAGVVAARLVEQKAAEVVAVCEVDVDVTISREVTDSAGITDDPETDVLRDEWGGSPGEEP